jgi:putative addiction module component (TIGR02574 family)
MSKPLDRIEAEALELPPQERARLAHRLLDSLEAPEVEDPAEVERAWKAEIERRVAIYDAGKAELVPGEQVLREARDRLRRKQ